MIRALEVGTSYLASGGRFGAGMRVAKTLGARPEKPLELYEFEACPFCRMVREALTVLDLEVLVRPLSKGGARHRPWVTERAGRAMFPYLVDPNVGAEMYESDDIIDHLFERYGEGRPPTSLKLGPLTTLSSSVASGFRFWRGAAALSSNAPDKPLELWGYEASPYCRIAREALCELELPYLLRNAA